MSSDLTPRALIGLPVDALFAPWSTEEVYQLNRRQELSEHSDECPRCLTELFATVDGWICARKGCTFRQPWVKEAHARRPYVPPQRRGR